MSVRLLRPPAVGVRPVIRVVAPSGPLVGHEGALHAGFLRLSAAGCKVRFDQRRALDCERGYLAGDDRQRADELLTALAEPGVDLVWFARGGSGGARTTEWVLAGAAGMAPRVVVGFSDATTLLNALVLRLGWVAFHGPVVTSLGRPGHIDFDLEGALEGLRGAARAPLPSPSAVSGRLQGGNLTVLASLAGTKLFPRCPGALWLLEDVGEAPYRLDRVWTQLEQAGLFAGASGIWLGDLGLDSPEAAVSEGALRHDLAPLPIVTGAPAGHRGRMALLPLGLEVAVEADGAWTSGVFVERRPGR